MRSTLALMLLLVAGIAQADADHYGCRIAYRPPQADYWFGHLLFGCRDEGDETPHIAVWAIGAETLIAIARLRDLVALNDGVEPLTTAEPQTASLCDRYWLWAEDEGARAPEMTRARKIEQACGR